MQPSTIAAPHLKCFIDGRLAGFVVGFNYSIDSSHRTINAIDEVRAQEHAAASYGVSANFAVISSRALLGLEGAGITVYADALPRQKYLTITIVDRITDKIVFQAESAVVENQSWSVQPKGLVTGQFSIKALMSISDPYRPDPNGREF